MPFRGPAPRSSAPVHGRSSGSRLAAALIDDATFAANLTNEGGVAGTFRLLKNVTGLWLLHECRAWALDGQHWSFEELVALAERAAPLRSLVDPDDPSFAAPGDMPARIRAFCDRTGQPVPESPGEVVRCALESIALGHARAVALLGRSRARAARAPRRRRRRAEPSCSASGPRTRPGCPCSRPPRRQP